MLDMLPLNKVIFLISIEEIGFAIRDPIFLPQKINKIAKSMTVKEEYLSLA